MRKTNRSTETEDTMPGSTAILEKAPDEFVAQCNAHGDVGKAESWEAANELLDKHEAQQH